MSKEINQFFERDLVLRIVSVLIGIIIWFIVLDQQNPLGERTVSIPLRTNREVLASSNISLVSSNLPNTVDVVIKGRKQRIEKVSSNDFNAFLDFSVIEDTKTTEIPIALPQYNGDQDIIVLDVIPKTVKINLESIVRKEFPINIKWVGELPEGYDTVNVKPNPNTVILQDLESVMNSVKNVSVTVDREQMLKGDSINKRIEVTNESGKVVSSLDGTVQINVSYSVAKSVPVTATVTGKPREDYYVKDNTLSQTSVTLTGDYEVLEAITEIKAEPLDVQGADASFQKELKLQIPEKVQLYKSSDKITAEVNIDKYSHRIVSLPKSSITIFGGDVTGKKRYRILEDEITFGIKGPGEILDTVDFKTIRGFVDVSDAGEGTETVEARISLPSGISMEDKVHVTVETEVVVLSVTPTPTPDNPEPTPTHAPHAPPEVTEPDLP